MSHPCQKRQKQMGGHRLRFGDKTHAKYPDFEKLALVTGHDLSGS